MRANTGMNNGAEADSRRLQELAQAGLYVHALPGRLRIEVPAIKRNPAAAKRLEARLLQVEGIRCVRACPVTGRMLVEFDAGSLDPTTIVTELGVSFRCHQAGSRTGESSRDSAPFQAFARAAGEALAKQVLQSALQALL